MNPKTILATVIFLMVFTDVSTLFKTKYKSTLQNIFLIFSSQLSNLFTIMCSNIANGTNNTLRDACIGCFQSAIVASNNQPSVASIVACATMYLINTNYSSCFNLPTVPPPTTTTPRPTSPTTMTTTTTTTTTTTRPPTTTTTATTTTRPPTTPTTPPPTTTPGIDPRLKRSLNININCDTGYCGYVQCIRSVNANLLIAGCYREARIGNNATFPNQQVNLYKNITSCILAKSRCSSINPISGQPQNGRYTTQVSSKFGTTTTAYYYTLQISSNGELRIIGLPSSISIQQDFCGTNTNLVESSWNSFVC
ncbi:hypothetical protein MML48_4g00009093 [Holotrichia oblita]|uniref:Uncharacterized protein n=1 Tax=Holotrichia oblita TaxID=644536 RepID=A0ACB9TAQ6_HOLOL|nr:hypothetical protein MML48_4g00009093 [Holotrichia oblita]